jgi:hypothetical protein
MASGEQHHLEFGGSPVTTEFPGRLQFRKVDRLPVISLSHTFDGAAAREVRYQLVATVGPERPFYHRYLEVILDVRMVSEWAPGAGEFVGALRDRMRSLGGELFVVAEERIPVPGETKVYPTPEEAIEAARARRAERRSAALTRLPGAQRG